MAINAGIDMSMEPYDLNFCTLLKELRKRGTCISGAYRRCGKTRPASEVQT